jgi:PAS domain-containing protein
MNNYLNGRITKVPEALYYRKKHIPLKIHDALADMDIMPMLLEGIQVIDFGWKYIYLNDIALTHGNKTRLEMYGKCMSDIYPGIEGTTLFRILEESMTQRKTLHFENEMVYADGSKKWFELKVCPVESGILVLSVDRSRRNETEILLGQSELRLREAQAIGHIGSWEIDLEKAQHRWSDEMYKIFGIEPGSMNPDMESFLSFVHEDDVVRISEGIIKASATFLSSSLNFSFKLLDGTLRYGFTKWEFELDDQGEACRIYGILQDVTESRLSEISLHRQNAEFALQTHEREKRASELEIANTELAFQNKEKEKRAAELVIANHTLEYENVEKQKMTEELFLANKELAHQNLEKEKRAMELFLINEELTRTDNELKLYVKGLEDMMFVTSHRVRQPVANIMGISDLLEDSSKSPGEMKKIVDYIKRSAASLDEFTRELTLMMEALKENKVK